MKKTKSSKKIVLKITMSMTITGGKGKEAAAPSTDGKPFILFIVTLNLNNFTQGKSMTGTMVLIAIPTPKYETYGRW